MDNTAFTLILLCILCTIPEGVYSRIMENFDIDICAYKYYCRGDTSICYPSYSMGYFQYDGDCVSSDVVYMYMHGTRYYPFYVTYKANQNQVLDGVPDFNDREITLLVRRLDVSNNKFSQFPSLGRYFQNLQTIKLINCNLMNVKLSGDSDFPSLTDVDLSHNNVNTVWCDENEYAFKSLKYLNLTHNRLNHLSDIALSNFDKLEILDVSYNYIEELGLSSFEGLKNIIHLNISHNSIPDINSSLFRFTKLESLDLSGNEIKYLKASDFSNLIHLKTLHVGFNLISSVDANVFNNLQSLKTLNLMNNKLDVINKDSFTNCTDLSSLDISNNHLKLLPKGLLKNKRTNFFSIKHNFLQGTLNKGIFEGLQFVPQLDMSNQYLDTVEDFAFYGLDTVQEILLNNNKIQRLTKKSFRMLVNLQHLDLSFNQIQDIDFEKDDLFKLITFSLKNNNLTVLKNGQLRGLDTLQFLDISDNKITHFESVSFKYLKDLTDFKLFNNPLVGDLEGGTFEGLSLLPSIDISYTLIHLIKNGSLAGMNQIKLFNVSHSEIAKIEYNCFINTGKLEVLDLSFNKLSDFYVNTTELINLNSLYLQNNLIKVLNSITFQGLLHLATINLSWNIIESVDNSFINMKFLESLDLSYNSHLEFDSLLMNNESSLQDLNLSGIKSNICFGPYDNNHLARLKVSDANFTDLKMLHVNNLRGLHSLVLSNNAVTKIDIGIFFNLSSLQTLDVSHNKISDITPGAFKDNIQLKLLNISHNYLTVLSYGIFRGLLQLQTLDISFNNIGDLDNERFYEVHGLEVLIADHNNIKYIRIENFDSLHLTKLSIGDNPIPCNLLVSFINSGVVNFQVTAIDIYDHNGENVHGIKCNKKVLGVSQPLLTANPASPHADSEVLTSIRDILLNHFNAESAAPKTTDNNDQSLVNEISDRMDKYYNSTLHKITDFANLTAKTINITSDSNALLGKILKVLTLNSVRRTPEPVPNKENATYDNLVAYINRVKQDIEDTVLLEKSEMEAKLVRLQKEIETKAMEIPKSDKLTSAPSVETRSIFTETCVAMILVILIGLILYKVYKSGVLVRRQLSISRHELPSAMDTTF